MHRDELVTSGDAAGFSVSTGKPGQWLRAMPAMVGTASLDWVLRILGIEVSAVEGLLGTSPPGANGSTCCPTWPPPANAPRSSTRSRPARSPACA